MDVDNAPSDELSKRRTPSMQAVWNRSRGEGCLSKLALVREENRPIKLSSGRCRHTPPR
jgi:hypothetical protein